MGRVPGNLANFLLRRKSSELAQAGSSGGIQQVFEVLGGAGHQFMPAGRATVPASVRCRLVLDVSAATMGGLRVSPGHFSTSRGGVKSSMHRGRLMAEVIRMSSDREELDAELTIQDQRKPNQ